MRLRLGFALAFLCFILSAASLAARPTHDAACIDGCERLTALSSTIEGAKFRAEIEDGLRLRGIDSFRVVAPAEYVSFKPQALADPTFTGGAIVAPAPGSAWTASYAILRNVSADSVVQKVGHLTFHHDGFNDIVIEPSVTLAANETRRIKDLSSNFDPDWKQYGVDAHGLYVLMIDPRLEASEMLIYTPGTAKFTLDSSGPYGPRAMTTVGAANDYVKIATDADTHTGTWATVINTNTSNVTLVLRQRGPFAGSDYVDTSVSAAPGVSQFPVGRSLPNGGTLTVCFLTCGVGAGGTAAPVYVVAIMGPNDGGTEAPIYPRPAQ